MYQKLSLNVEECVWACLAAAGAAAVAADSALATSSTNQQ